jgi:hypothetical protein
VSAFSGEGYFGRLGKGGERRVMNSNWSDISSIYQMRGDTESSPRRGISFGDGILRNHRNGTGARKLNQSETRLDFGVQVSDRRTFIENE